MTLQRLAIYRPFVATVTASWTSMHRRLIPRSLQGRLLLTYLILMLLGLGGLILWTGLRLQTAVVEEAEHSLELEALIMAHALYEPLEKRLEGENPEGPTLDTLVRSYAKSVGVRVTVVGPSLQVLLSSDEAVPIHFEHEHPEIVAARAGGEQHDLRWDEWRREERLFVAAPILSDEEEFDGVLQLSVPMAPLYAEMQRTWMSLVAAGAVVLAATALASFLLARQVAGPIRSLTAVTEGMAAGNLSQQVTPAGPDEVERLGRAFNRMAEQVREMLAHQQAFVANAAHELRSPLTSLRLRIEMLQRHGQHDPHLAQRYLRQMDGTVNHLQRLVDHLLALSRLDEGQELPRSPLDLAPILYELADDMGPLAQAAGLCLHVDVPPHLPTVMARADSMRMVVRNLLDNAIKYTLAGGEVTLQATTDDAAPTVIHRSGGAPQPVLSVVEGSAACHEPSRKAGGQSRSGQPSVVIIQVIDTGPGIPAEHLPQVFGRFYRVDKIRSRRQGGAGLGLSLVRSIVEAYGGQVSVKSQMGQGSTFTVYLPMAANVRR